MPRTAPPVSTTALETAHVCVDPAPLSLIAVFRKNPAGAGFQAVALKSVIIPASRPSPMCWPSPVVIARRPLQIGADIIATRPDLPGAEHGTLSRCCIRRTQGCGAVFAQWPTHAVLGRHGLNQPRGAQHFCQWRPRRPRPLGRPPPDEHHMQRLRPPDATAATARICGAWRTWWKSTISVWHRSCGTLRLPPVVHTPVVPVMADIFQATPAVLEWMDWVAALGHGRMRNSARQMPSPRPQGPNPYRWWTIFSDEHGIALAAG